MTEDHREDGWWMANDGNLYPPELHPSVSDGSDGLGANHALSPSDPGAVGPQFPDLFQAALNGNHLADNVLVMYDGEDQRNEPVAVSAGASHAAVPSTRGGAGAPLGPVGEYTGATPAKRRWRRH
ncbi:MAG: hypothetical protein WB565_11555 [Acidimicrobiales bacterium]